MFFCLEKKQTFQFFTIILVITFLQILVFISISFLVFNTQTSQNTLIFTVV